MYIVLVLYLVYLKIDWVSINVCFNYFLKIDFNVWNILNENEIFDFSDW